MVENPHAILKQNLIAEIYYFFGIPKKSLFPLKYRKRYSNLRNSKPAFTEFCRTNMKMGEWWEEYNEKN